MTKAFDYAADEKLAATLPQALLNRMTQIQQARIDAGHTSKDGFTYRTLERKEFSDALFDWKANGRPQDELPALKAKEQELRQKGLF